MKCFLSEYARKEVSHRHIPSLRRPLLSFYKEGLLPVLDMQGTRKILSFGLHLLR